MPIEGIKSAGMTYQGVTSKAVTRQVTEQRTETVSTEQVAEQLTSKKSDFVVQESGTASERENMGDQRASAEIIKKVVNEMNRERQNSTVLFGIHEATNRMTIKVVDKQTKEVIKEFPPEKTLDIIAKTWELAGILVDEKR